MNRKKENGLWLRQMEHESRKKNAWILAAFVAILASGILLLTTNDMIDFYIVYTPGVMLGGAVILGAVYGVMMKYEKPDWFFTGSLIWLLLLVVIGKRKILNGFCIIYNHVGDIWTTNSGRVLPELEAISQNLFWFSVFTGSLIALLCCAVDYFERRLFAILIPAGVFMGMFVLGKKCSGEYIIACLLFAICVLVSNSKKGVEKILEAAVSRWMFIGCMSLLLLMAIAVLNMENHVIEISDKLHGKLHDARYETAYTSLPEGELSDYAANNNPKQTALVVNMDKPQELYLRGFTGAVFENDTWSPLDTKVLAENEELLYWMNINEWDLHTQFAQAVSSVTEEAEDKQTVTVQNINACSQYLYVPYQLCQGEYLEENNIHTDGVLSDGTRTYLYEVCTGGRDAVQETLELLQKTENEKVEDYRKAEQTYREFVYRNYLGISKEDKEAFLPYWEEAENAPEFLDTYFQGEENSFTYATAAVLTMRYFGIPARYVEGYIITDEMAKNAEDGSSIKVPESCGGAWVEVYQDGIGWVPMDVTPGIEKEQKSMGENGENGDAPKERPPKGKELKEEPEETKEEPQSGSIVSVPQMMSWTGVFILLLLIIMVLVLVIRRKIILKRRQRRWEEQSIKDGTGWIFADTAKLLERLGFHRGNGSMWNLVLPVKQCFGEKYANDFEEMVNLNARAMFSSCIFAEEDREKALTFYHGTLQHLKANKKWHERLWMQWILCLY